MPTLESASLHIALARGIPKTRNPLKLAVFGNDVPAKKTMIPQTVTLYKRAEPTETLIPSLADGPHTLADGPLVGSASMLVGLQTGMTWSDGHEITADDVVFSMELLQAKGVNLFGNPLPNALQIEKLGSHQVKLSFASLPPPLVWESVVTAPIFPKHYWEPYATAGDDVAMYADAVGVNAPAFGAFAYDAAETQYPYKIVWSKTRSLTGGYVYCSDGRVSLLGSSLATTDYGGGACSESETGSVRVDYGPFVDSIEWYVYAAERAMDTGFAQLLAGKVHMLDMDQTFADKFIASYTPPQLLPGSTRHINPQAWNRRSLYFETTHFPTNYKSFRQAVACQIDREALFDTPLSNDRLLDDCDETKTFYEAQGCCPSNSFESSHDCMPSVERGATATKLDDPVVEGDPKLKRPVMETSTWTGLLDDPSYNAASRTGVLEECAGLSAAERFERAVAILQADGWTADDWGSASADGTIVPPTGLRGPQGETSANMTVPGSAARFYQPGKLVVPILNTVYDPWRTALGYASATAAENLGVEVDKFETDFDGIIGRTNFGPGSGYYHMLQFGWSANELKLISQWDHYIDFASSCTVDSMMQGAMCMVLRNGNIAPVNIGRYANPTYDAIRESAFAAMYSPTTGYDNPEATKAVVKQLQAIVDEDVPVVPLYSAVTQDILYHAKLPFARRTGGLVDTNELPSVIQVTGAPTGDASVIVPPPPPPTSPESRFGLPTAYVDPAELDAVELFVAQQWCGEDRTRKNSYGATCADVSAAGFCAYGEPGLWPSIDATATITNAQACPASCQFNCEVTNTNTSYTFLDVPDFVEYNRRDFVADVQLEGIAWNMTRQTYRLFGLTSRTVEEQYEHLHQQMPYCTYGSYNLVREEMIMPRVQEGPVHPFVKSVVAHELVHAFQGAYFKLKEWYLGLLESGTLTSAFPAIRALLEAHAEAIEEAFANAQTDPYTILQSKRPIDLGQPCALDEYLTTTRTFYYEDSEDYLNHILNSDLTQLVHTVTEAIHGGGISTEEIYDGTHSPTDWEHVGNMTIDFTPPASYAIRRDTAITALGTVFMLQPHIGKLAAEQAAIGLGSGRTLEVMIGDDVSSLCMLMKLDGDTPEHYTELASAFASMLQSKGTVASVPEVTVGSAYTLPHSVAWMHDDGTVLRMAFCPGQASTIAMFNAGVSSI